MGNFIFGYNFKSYTATASSTEPGYPVANIYDYEHPRLQWRSMSIASEQWVKAYTGATNITLRGVMLNDVNFTNIKIQHNTTDSWPGTSADYTVTQDERTGRYKIYVPFNASAKYVRIVIPAQAVTDNLPAFRIGCLIILDTIVELSVNPSFPYTYDADEKMATNEFESGGFDDVNLGARIWSGSFGFQVHDRAYESEIWWLNRIGKNANLVFYENCGDRSKCYQCRRRTPVQVVWDHPFANTIQTLTFREKY